MTSAQEEWRTKTLEYAAAINAYVAEGIAKNWEDVGPEPPDPGLEHLASDAIAAVREANETGELERLRELWPPAHLPLIPMLEENGQSIPTVCFLPDGSLVARIGAPYGEGRVVHIQGDEVLDVPNVEFFGRSPNRKYFAIAREEGVEVVEGWGGPQVAMCRWPTGHEDIPDGYELPGFADPPVPTQLIPFPNGQRVLLVSCEGIYVLSTSAARRLLPSKESLVEWFEWLQKEHPDDDLSFDLSMEHGAISADGELIAIGAQDSKHLVFDSWLEQIGDIGHESEYPHYALFSADGSVIAFNSCHFYNGLTIGVPASLLPGLETESYAEDERVPTIEEGARVYAGASRDDEFIVGDANGYVIGFSVTGEPRWRQFIGSSVGAIDISDDGKLLAVSTYAGFLALIRLDDGSPPPYQIGTSNHAEFRRWVFWSQEPKPLIW